MDFESIVVGFDGSANAKLALAAAKELVSEDGVVHVVTAHGSPSASELGQLMETIPSEYRSGIDLLAAPKAYLDEATSLLKRDGLKTERHLVENRPAGAILDVADDVEADLIIVGSRGLGRGTRFLRGSVSSRVAAHARTSFMVVHDTEDEQG